VLAVVEDQKRVAFSERRDERDLDRHAALLWHADRLGDRRGDHRRVSHMDEVDEPHAVAASRGGVGGDAQREPRLADATRTGRGDHAVLGQCHRQRRPFGCATDERRDRHGQRAVARPDAKSRHRRSVPRQAAAIGKRQLSKQRGHVTFHGARRDEQRIGDLRVRQVPGDQVKDLCLPGRHLRALGRAHGRHALQCRPASPVPTARSPCRAPVWQIRGDHGCASDPARRASTGSEFIAPDQPQFRSRSMTTIENPVRNGVDTATLFATLDAVKGDTDIAKFQFRATNRWVSGTHNRSTIHGYYGAKQEMTHQQPFTFDADHPPVLVGTDNGPTPVEYVLHALAACLTAGIANVAAARGITLTEVSSTVEGDIDLLGILGLSDEVRNGYQQIKVSFTLRGDDPEKLRSVVEQSRRRSAVFDIVTNGVPVSIDVDAG
jgi:uncharacterized OsmC-like protein